MTNLIQKESVVEMKLKVIKIYNQVEQDNNYTKELIKADLLEILRLLEEEDRNTPINKTSLE